MLVDQDPRLMHSVLCCPINYQEDEEGLEESSLPALRRGNRIMDDAASAGSESEDDAGAPDPPSEVKWNLPAGFGFTLGEEPSKLDELLVGQ